jgi:hypothetical protein
MSLNFDFKKLIVPLGIVVICLSLVMFNVVSKFEPVQTPTVVPPNRTDFDNHMNVYKASIKTNNPDYANYYQVLKLVPMVGIPGQVGDSEGNVNILNKTNLIPQAITEATKLRGVMDNMISDIKAVPDSVWEGSRWQNLMVRLIQTVVNKNLTDTDKESITKEYQKYIDVTLTNVINYLTKYNQPDYPPLSVLKQN